MVVALAGSMAASTIGPPKAKYRDLRSDRRQSHQEAVGGRSHDYVISFRGNVDGVMTRMPVGHAAFVQGWQPNRSLLIENVGRADVRNPRLIVNGRGDWRNLESIVAEATRGWTEPRDRARAIWEFARRHRFHATTWDAEVVDAVKMLNVYGYTLCGDQTSVLDALWQSAGFRIRRGHPVGHVVGEVFYDDAYHMMDGDLHVICLERDNETIASEEAITRDHDLIKRTHTYGIYAPEDRSRNESTASLYGYDGVRDTVIPPATNHSMMLVLRPGESLEFRWDHVGKQYTNGLAAVAGRPVDNGVGDLFAGWGRTAYDNMRNGRLRYRPDLTDALAQQGVETSKNVVFDTGSGEIRSLSWGGQSYVTWRFRSPYVIVGGRASSAISGDGQRGSEWRYSTDGETWSPLPATFDGRPRRLSASLDHVVSRRGAPTYEFFLQLVLRGSTVASDVIFETDIQTSLLGLPELTVGENRVSYADDTDGERRVRITHEWMERVSWHPPGPPVAALSPADGSDVEGTKVEFDWTDSSDPDGDAIAGYHFELSAHSDMRWPLSSNFERLIRPTQPGFTSRWKSAVLGVFGEEASPIRAKDASRWEVPYAGLLNPDTDYFWRVRALDSTGVWGAWSPVFRFRCRAAGVPQDLRLTRNERGGYTLSWKPNANGRQPLAYKVYGSDERGFTASDSKSMVFHGRGFVRTMQEYEAAHARDGDKRLVRTPANFITLTTGTSLDVVGTELALPNTNRAFYRVVALDAAGNASGPSDYVEVSRPMIYSHPPQGRVGEPYEYRLQYIRSLGDLRNRASEKSSYNIAFWDRETVSFSAISLPDGLSLDEATGEICGLPLRVGSQSIELEVTSTPGECIQVRQSVEVAP
ncbi:MAG: hypothetical protein NDJ92_01230 [Thermoanaerobaculia bacterium]|nr:hypothetical protein [Thermoanaerobaculia bacterium]